MKDIIAIILLGLLLVIIIKYTKDIYNEPCYQRSTIEVPKCR